MSQVMSTIKQFASKFNHNKRKHKPGESTSSRPGWMVRDSHLTIGGLRMTNTTAGTFTELKETSSQRVLSPLFPHSRLPLAIRVPRGEQARMGSPKWRHPLMFVASLSLLSFPFFLATPTHADSITVSISGNPSITVAPSSTGTFADSGNINISVSNAPASGYTLAITGGGNTSLTGTTDSTKAITSIGSNLSPAQFAADDCTTTVNNTTTNCNNKWGYKPSMHYNTSTEQRATNSNYLPSPTSSADIIDITSDNSSNNYQLSIGARVTNDLGFQTYENNTYTITAIPNILPTPEMQDMDPSRCISSNSTAIDSRDGIEYPIATLADGACWMTQNLRLGSGGNQVNLTSADSDITSSFSFTPSSAWSGIFTSANIDTPQAYYSGDTSLGSYYNWYTATAGTGNSSTAAGAEVSGSICPKGWVLPNRAEYTMLLSQYNNDSDKLWSPAIPDFVITGYYKDSSYNQNTTHTYAWERTAKSASSGDNMFIRVDKAAATDGMSKYFGMPVRCRLGGDKASFIVNYNANGGSGSMASQSTTSGNITLNNNAFIRSGYTFAGWSADSNATEPTYKPGNTIISYSDALNIYAVWQQDQPITFNMDSNTSSIDIIDSNGATVKTITASGQTATLAQGSTYTIKPTHTTGYTTNTVTKTSGAGTLSGKEFTVGAGAATINVTSKQFCVGSTIMQNLTSSTIASLLPNVGSTATVCDIRDGEEYKISKLADNKYWMLDNLRLDPANSTTLNNITASNTHASATSITRFKNGGGTTSDQYPTAKINNVAWTSSSQNYYSIPMTINTYKNQTTTSYGTGSGKIGVYYNYCAASAGSYCYGNGTSVGTSSGNATEDLCPSGWRMPTGGSSGELQALYTAYSSNATNFRNALSTPLSGYFYDGKAYNHGTYGSLWSSTRNDSYSMYDLFVLASSVYPTFSGNRYYGYSLRCIAQ